MNAETQNQHKLTGECLCGSVKFEVVPPFRDIVSCYCSECRKTSGNFVSATSVSEHQIDYIEQSGLAWFSTDLADHGFCQLCGSNLLWKKAPYEGRVSVMAGCLGDKTGLEVVSHIYVGNKSDFHEVGGSAPQYDEDYR